MSESPSAAYLAAFARRKERDITSRDVAEYVDTLARKMAGRPPPFLATDAQFREIQSKHPVEEVPAERPKIDYKALYAVAADL